QRVLVADLMEGLRLVVARKMHLDLNVLGQHRHVVISADLRRLAQHLERFLARHRGAYFAAGFMVWRSNSRPAIAVLLCAAYLSHPQAATGKGSFRCPHLPQTRRAASPLN